MSEFFQQFMPARVFQASRPVSRTLAQGILVSGVAGALIGIAGCGSNLRPTVTPIVGTGPASQPASYAFVVSAPTSSSTAQGYGTVIDYSGDTVMATAPIGPGPNTFALNAGGTEAWTVNVDGTVSNVPVSTQLQEKLITYSTLNEIPAAGTANDPAGLDPVVALYGGSLGLYALDANLNELDVLTGSPDAFKLDVPVDQAPVTMVSVAGATRAFVITQGFPYLQPYTLPGGATVGGVGTFDGGVACTAAPHQVGIKGVADGIETGTYTVSSQIPVGVCPDYAIGSPDTRRVYVLNRGDDTISVINSQFNTPDNLCPPPTGCVNQNGQTYFGHPTLPLSTAAVTATGITPPNGAAGLPSTAGPVYAEFNTATQQLIVSNYDGNTVNIIDVSLDAYGNDSKTFGTTYTVNVGKNPASVTVLADGSRAYTANQTDGTVSVIDMASHTVETTLPVTGNPRTVVSTQNSLFGKVYVVSPNSPTVTLIRTDQDIIDTTVLVQGNAVDVRVTSPDTTASNANLTSRLPGAGQPCYLPPSAFTSSTPVTLSNCKSQDPTLLTSATLSTAVRSKAH